MTPALPGAGAAKDRLALAMDLPLERAFALYPEVSASGGWVKVGLSLFVEHGPAAVAAFRRLGARVFLDLKLHDIPNTVELAAERAGALGVELLTVHASGGEAMLRAAVAGARRGAARAHLPAPRLLAVTVLTSMNEQALGEVGIGGTVASQVERLAGVAVRAGVEGIVCSAHEAVPLRRLHPSLFLCTPGIRPAGGVAGDQQRVETPAQALQSGSDLLVVGRPIYDAANPAQAAAQLLAEMAAALSEFHGQWS